MHKENISTVSNDKEYVFLTNYKLFDCNLSMPYEKKIQTGIVHKMSANYQDAIAPKHLCKGEISDIYATTYPERITPYINAH